MGEQVVVTFKGSREKRKLPDLRVVMPGFDVLPLRRGGGVELLGSGHIQFLSDEARARPDTGNLRQSIDVLKGKSKRRPSRRHPNSRTKLQFLTIRDGGTVFITPQDTHDRFKHAGRVFPSIEVTYYRE